MTVQRPRSCRRVTASPAVLLGIAQALPTSQERGRDLNPFSKRSQAMTPRIPFNCLQEREFG